MQLSMLSFLVRFLILSHAFWCRTTLCSTALVPPSEDKWYIRPQGLENPPPGTVLRLREAPGHMEHTISGVDSAWNIMYQTTDSHYRLTYAVTTLLVPLHASGDTLLCYQIAYDSADIDASPSYVLNTSPAPNDLRAIESGLAGGWHVNVPDYEAHWLVLQPGLCLGTRQ